MPSFTMLCKTKTHISLRSTEDQSQVEPQAGPSPAVGCGNIKINQLRVHFTGDTVLCAHEEGAAVVPIYRQEWRGSVGVF